MLQFIHSSFISDALLADLQSTTNPNLSQAPHNSTGSSQQRYSSSSAQSPRTSGRGETPPPLPPPPHDIPDTIPPPQQFVDQVSVYTILSY